MNPRAILVILLAALGVIIFALMTRSFLNSAQEQTEAAQGPVDEIEIYIAKSNLPVGTLIGPDHYEVRYWPKASMTLVYLQPAKAEDKPDGKVVRLAMAEGQPFSKNALVAAGDRGFLAAALQPGMRAATVQVTPW